MFPFSDSSGMRSGPLHPESLIQKVSPAMLSIRQLNLNICSAYLAWVQELYPNEEDGADRLILVLKIYQWHLRRYAKKAPCRHPSSAYGGLRLCQQSSFFITAHLYLHTGLDRRGGETLHPSSLRHANLLRSLSQSRLWQFATLCHLGQR
jgi:hypothetical protein